MNLPEHSAHASSVAHYHNNVAGRGEREFSQSTMARELTFLRSICHGNAVNAGWYTDLETGEYKQLNVGERCMLIVTEVAEAFEGHRKNLMDDHLPSRRMIEVELADAIIRIMDFCGAEDLDIAGAIIDKVQYNLKRADHKIENRKGVNGKKC